MAVEVDITAKVNTILETKGDSLTKDTKDYLNAVKDLEHAYKLANNVFSYSPSKKNIIEYIKEINKLEQSVVDLKAKSSGIDAEGLFGDLKKYSVIDNYFEKLGNKARKLQASITSFKEVETAPIKVLASELDNLYKSSDRFVASLRASKTETSENLKYAQELNTVFKSELTTVSEALQIQKQRTEQIEKDKADAKKKADEEKRASAEAQKRADSEQKAAERKEAADRKALQDAETLKKTTIERELAEKKLADYDTKKKAGVEQAEAIKKSYASAKSEADALLKSLEGSKSSLDFKNAETQLKGIVEQFKSLPGLSKSVAGVGYSKELESYLGRLKTLRHEAAASVSLTSVADKKVTGTPGLSTEQALLELDREMTAEQRKQIALQQEVANKKAQASAKQAEDTKNTAAAFRQLFDSQSKLTDAWQRYYSNIESVRGKLRELNSVFEEGNARLSNAFQTKQYDIISSDLSIISNKFSEFNTLVSSSNANSAELVNKYKELGSLITIIQGQASSLPANAPTDLTQQIAGLSGQYNQLGQQLQSNIADRLKSGFKELGTIAKKSFNDIYNISKTIITKSASYLKSAFTSVLNSIGDKFKSIFSSSSSSGVGQQLKSLLLGAGIAKGFKSAIDLSSELTEAQNRLDYTFGESAGTITEFARTSAKDFGLTENAATKFSATFGGILSSSGIASDELAGFSENLTKMTGDLASFYDVDQDVFFKKLQAGLAGNAAALRTYGINVSATNLELYRMSKGIQTAYKDMDQASKITLRYNYIVESASQAQGDFARTQFTWANQIRLLKSQFQSLAAIIGGYFVKTLLPVVRILNQIVQAAINAFTALASLFGFDSDSIKALTGGAKGTVFDESAAGYIDDTANALGNESDALDKTGKAAKEAADNLQGFDKLNNITTSKASGAGSGGSGASGVGAGIKPLDWASLTKAPDIEKTPLEKWFDEFYNLLKNKKWKEAGKSLGTQLNNLTNTIYNKLTDPKVKEGIHNFNNALTDFYDGLLIYDTKKLGQTIGAGINLIAFSINDLYEQAVKKDLLKRTGEKIADFFYGLVTEVKWNEVGKAFTTGFRTAMDILAGFLEKAKELDLGKEIGTAVKDFLEGAVERLFGNGGAKEIGNNISGVMNLAFEAFATAFGKGSDGTSAVDDVADGILTAINTAIEGIDENDLADALTALLGVIGTLFGMLGDIDTDTLSDKISYAINTAADNGSLSDAVSGVASAILNMFNLLGKTFEKIDWSSVGTAIWEGLSDALDTTDGEEYIFPVFATIFGVKLLGKVVSFGLSSLGNKIVSTLAGCISGSKELTTLHDSVKGAVAGSEADATIAATSVGNSVAGAFNAAVSVTLAITAIVATQIYNARKDIEKWHKELEKETEDMKKEVDDTGKLSLFNTEDTDMETFTAGLEKVTLAYNGLNENMRALATQVDSNNPLNKIEASVQSLLNKDQVFDSLKLAIDGLTDAGYNNSEVMSKLQDFYNNGFDGSQADEVLKTIGLALKDCQSASEGLTEALQEGSDGADLFANSFSDGVVTARDKAKTEIDGFVTDLDGIKPSFSESGTALGQSMLSGVSTEISNDTTVDTATSNLITDATAEENSGSKTKGHNMMLDALSSMSSTLYGDTTVDTATSDLITDATSDSNTQASRSGKGVATSLTAGVTAALFADATVDNATSSLVAGATSESNTLAKSKGAGVASDITSGATSKLATDTSFQTSEANLVARATSDSNTQANTKGAGVGNSLTDAMATAVNTDKKSVEAMTSLVAKSTANETIKAYESGKSAGENVIDGIDAGIKDDKKQAGVFTGIRSFATNLFTNFKDVLGIHSPSRVFKSLAAFIPDGIALGVEDNAKVATKAIGDMCSSLSGEFENTDLDTNSLISTGKFDGMYDSLMRQTDMAFDYVASKFDNLRDMINLQSSLVVNPSVNRANLEAAYASASDVSGVVRSVGNIYSKLATSGLGSSNKPVQVNVYLDKNNKLSSYIINTVNGNVTKTGNF